MVNLLEAILILATLLSALIAGFVFAFASVVMPGIGKLGDKAFIRAFQVIDGIIQAGQPVFGMVFMGSIAALLLGSAMSIVMLDGQPRALILLSTVAYVTGVLLPTFRINVPMNNALQQLDTDTMDLVELHTARGAFERRWVLWNTIRTLIAVLVSAALMLVLTGL